MDRWVGEHLSLLILWTSLETNLSLGFSNYKNGTKHIYYKEISTAFGRAHSLTISLHMQGSSEKPVLLWY